MKHTACSIVLIFLIGCGKPSQATAEGDSYLHYATKGEGLRLRRRVVCCSGNEAYVRITIEAGNYRW